MDTYQLHYLRAEKRPYVITKQAEILFRFESSDEAFACHTLANLRSQAQPTAFQRELLEQDKAWAIADCLNRELLERAKFDA